MVILSSELVTSFFSPTINKIADCLLRLRGNTALCKLHRVYLVGGFSRSPLLERAVRGVLEHAGCSVVAAQRPDLAIVIGAVLYATERVAFNSRSSPPTCVVNLRDVCGATHAVSAAGRTSGGIVCGSSPKALENPLPDPNDDLAQESSQLRAWLIAAAKRGRLRAAAERGPVVLPEVRETDANANDRTDVATLNPSEGLAPSKPGPQDAQPTSFSEVTSQPQHSQAALEVELVNQFGSSPNTFSSAEDGIRLHVHAGCLREDQVAGPIIIRASERYFVQCAGEAFLVSEVVDCQPSGIQFHEPLYLDFRVDESFEEDSEGKEGGEDERAEHEDELEIIAQREEYMRSIVDSYKVRHRVVQWLRGKGVNLARFDETSSLLQAMAPVVPPMILRVLADCLNFARNSLYRSSVDRLDRLCEKDDHR